MADDFMDMNVNDRIAMRLAHYDCSSPVAIPHGDGTENPPCTPCTPPHEDRE
ncbi:hypothetical protein OESDEN_15772 [Oesophagostomum dentatum]|uniref:Uncharacterized protein n=1 Tax=Oesophagostomum dentatum TaxID=61180 RepID=A0A0B1SLW0_OESDE|nr:hypothetical protein OESDEN_15772 [Oesophagostomum dentatum]